MAQKTKLSQADLQDLVPKLDQFVSSLNPSQQSALSRPFAAQAKGQTHQKSIQDFLDQKVGKVNSHTRSIVMGIVGGGGRGTTAGIVGGGGRGTTAGIVGGGGRGTTAGIVGAGGRGTTAGIVGGPGRGKTAGKASAKPKKKTK